MANVKVLPHRIADPAAVDWGTWWLRVNGDRRPSEQLLDGWDYSTPLTFEVQASIDAVDFLESTGLDELADCEIVALVECPTTGYRFEARRSLADLANAADKLLVVEPPLGTLAVKVLLSQFIVLSRSITPSADDVAWQRGARLASGPSRSVTLEGSAARFPTEAVAFSTLRFPEALWSLQSSWLDAEDAFTASIRLFVNTEHPRAEALLDTAHPEHGLVHSALELDIVRQLLVRAQADREQFRDSQRPWPEGSTGAALENLTDLFFGTAVYEMLTLQRTDPETFERMLQARLDLFGGKP